MHDTYFAAANTSEGFVSYYDSVFGNSEKVYIIKGGSGTGKSRLMKELAEYAEESGATVERFLCSFDPGSLDGILINGTIAVLDGTAPHVYEAVLPGIRDNIIDMGQFWDIEALETKRNEIVSLMNEKKLCFESAYKYLSSFGEIRAAITKKLANDIKWDKISGMIAAECGPKACKDKTKTRIKSAFGRRGLVELETYTASSPFKIRFSDCNNTQIGPIMLEGVLHDGFIKERIKALSYAPLWARKPDAFLMENDTAIELCDNNADYDLSDFLKSEWKRCLSEVKETAAICDRLCALALESMKKAADFHSKIESVYISAMNFGAKESYTEELKHRIIK